MTWVTSDPHGRPAIPKWIVSFPTTWGTGTTTQVGVNGTCFLTCFYLPRPVTVSLVTCEITTAGGAGTKFRLGLYADSNGTPVGGARLFDSGDQDATIIGTKVLALPAAIAMPAGFVWACLETNDATVQFRRMIGQPVFTEQGSEALEGCSFNQTYGALPAICPAISIAVTTNFCSRLRITAVG